MAPARDDAIPVYVQTQGAVVGKSGEQLEVKQKGQVLQRVRLMEISHLALFGNVQVTTHRRFGNCATAASPSVTSPTADGSEVSPMAWGTKTWNYAAGNSWEQ